MTEHLYYSDSFLYDFEAKVTAVVHHEGRTAVVLDRTAFYPTSGGQVFDTGWLEVDGARLRVDEVGEEGSGNILHYVRDITQPLLVGTAVHGLVDRERRFDHIQQHSGQHVLSAAFERLSGMPTVSFHMGDESCTIDLVARSVSEEQIRGVEREANRVVTDDLPVEIRAALPEHARAMGVRKIPDHVEGELRLIDMRGYDLNACGGTHVRSTGQIGPILLRKYEKVKQGIRVEFVCGGRATATARKDFDILSETARIYDTHIWQVPELVRKSIEEGKAAGKERKKLVEEIAELLAGRVLAEAAATSGGFKLIVRVFEDRDTAFIKLLAQKMTAAESVVALLGAKAGQAGVVFAQTPGLRNDMGAMMKEALAVLGGRGGGNRDLAQGGAGSPEKMSVVLEGVAAKVRESL